LHLKKKQASLDRKLETRLPKSHLESHNILKDTKIQPSIQATHQILENERKKDKLETYLEKRPSLHDLEGKHILDPTAEQPPST